MNLYQLLFSSLYILGIDFNFVRTQPWPRRNNVPYVVTRYEELAQYYLELRPQNPQILSNLTAEMKDDICRFTHHSFEGSWMKPEMLTTELRRNHNRYIFDVLFERKQIATILRVPEPMEASNEDEEAEDGVEGEGLPVQLNGAGNNAENHEQNYEELTNELGEAQTTQWTLVNVSKLLLVFVKGEWYTEVAFMCLFRDADTGELHPYYVSDYEYNVNDAPTGMRIEGRFIFFNQQVYALAEIQPPIRINRVFEMLEESCYVSQHIGRCAATNPMNDPVCKLDNGRKLRLCTYVCMQLMMPRECRTERVTSGDCIRKDFRLGDRWYNAEWTIECSVAVGARYHRRTVSRGYCNNEVFVFITNNGGEITSRFTLTNVSVVVESGNS